MGAGTKRSTKEPMERKRAQHPLWKACVLAFGVTWLAALVRWWPLTQYAVWGSDIGEHGALLDNYIAKGGQMPSNYLGWGGGYPDFPGMYAFASAFASISGVDPFTVLSVVVPAAASLTALLAFAMTLRLSGSLRASTLGGALGARVSPGPLAGSPGSPGPLGGVLAFAIVPPL